MENNLKTDKTILIKGIKTMGLSLICMFLGPILFYLAESNNEKALYIPLLVFAFIICMLAVYLAFKGLKIIMNSMFKK